MALVLRASALLACALAPVALASDVPFVPTPDRVVDRMLAMAKVGPKDVVYDLGCGDGRIVIAAARKYRARAIGIDIDPERIRESRENARMGDWKPAATAGVGDNTVYYWVVPERQ